jgi:hypothetical protein
MVVYDTWSFMSNCSSTSTCSLCYLPRDLFKPYKSSWFFKSIKVYTLSVKFIKFILHLHSYRCHDGTTYLLFHSMHIISLQSLPYILLKDIIFKFFTCSQVYLLFQSVKALSYLMMLV